MPMFWIIKCKTGTDAKGRRKPEARANKWEVLILIFIFIFIIKVLVPFTLNQAY